MVCCSDCGVELAEGFFGWSPVVGGPPRCDECAYPDNELVVESPYPPRTNVTCHDPTSRRALFEVEEQRGPFVRRVLIAEELVHNHLGSKAHASAVRAFAVKLALDKMAPSWNKAPGPDDPVYASYCAWLASEGRNRERQEVKADHWAVHYGLMPGTLNAFWDAPVRPTFSDADDFKFKLPKHASYPILTSPGYYPGPETA
jgi:hypothetical protein